MFLELGKKYTISLLIKDVNGLRITTDSPFATIINNEEKYFNGISWIDTETRISMTHTENGYYTLDFIPDKVGVYKINAISEIYQINNTETLEVYDENLIKYSWLTNSLFTVKYSVSDITSVPTIEIERRPDKTFYDGMFWVESPTQIPMNPTLNSEEKMFTFTPTLDGDYSIKIVDSVSQKEVLMLISCSGDGDSVEPIIVGSRNIKSPNGTDCVLLDENNNPLQGVKISVYSQSTKELIQRTSSDENGEWEIVIKPQDCIFMFEKDGYASQSFQRVVM